MTQPSVDFLKALELKEATAEITIGGRRLLVPRAGLGLHYRLQAILEEHRDDLGEAAAAYVAAASGLSLEEIDVGTSVELLTAFAALSELNRFRGSLAVLWPARSPDSNGQKPEDYPHRGLASVVARLAHAYGWPVDHILGMGPEEAMCFLQEARVIEHEESEFRWRMAGGGKDKDGRTVKFPSPWGRPPEPERARRSRPLPAHLRPSGIVISASQILKGGAQ